MKLLQNFIGWNITASRILDTILPSKFNIDGNSFFIETFAPAYIYQNLTVYDVGGGKQPFICREIKDKYKLTVVGFDVDMDELYMAPEGIYDKKICSDITNFHGNTDADLIICQALLEHVKDVDKAFASISSILKSGGKALIFVPSRNAIYARINNLLPQKIKKYILHAIYPHTRSAQGFPSYYDRCTPKDFRLLAKKYGLIVERESFHYISSYFTFFVPLYLLWRGWILLFHAVAGEQAAETFCMALSKP